MGRVLIDAKWLKSRFEDLFDDREVEMGDIQEDPSTPERSIHEMEGEVNGIFACMQLLDKIIKEHPIDAVEVVRCKECDCYDKDRRWCSYHGIEMRPNDYCKYGEG